MEDKKNENEIIINERYCLISHDYKIQDNPIIHIIPKEIEGF